MKSKKIDEIKEISELTLSNTKKLFKMILNCENSNEYMR